MAFGGEKRTTKGFWVDPTSMGALHPSETTELTFICAFVVFVDVKPTMKIVREEVSF